MLLLYCSYQNPKKMRQNKKGMKRKRKQKQKGQKGGVNF